MKTQRDHLVLRAAGGPATGIGHLVRTRAIAQECERRRLTYELIVDDEQSAAWLRMSGIESSAVSTRPDWLDSSPRGLWLDGFRDWQEELARIDPFETCTILVENRVADRDAAAFVVYPALHYEPDAWDLAHPDRVRGGADWVPLSREVLQVRPSSRDIDLLVSFGGSDPGLLTERTLECLASFGFKGRVVTVLGPRMGDRREQIETAAAALHDHQVVDGKEGIVQLEARSRVAITALGTTLYELAYFGVSALILANYEKDAAALDWYRKRGNHIPLGVASEQSGEALCRALKAGLAEIRRRPEASPLDLAGGSRRIVDLMMTESVHA